MNKQEAIANELEVLNQIKASIMDRQQQTTATHSKVHQEILNRFKELMFDILPSYSWIFIDGHTKNYCYLACEDQRFVEQIRQMLHKFNVPESFMVDNNISFQGRCVNSIADNNVRGVRLFATDPKALIAFAEEYKLDVDYSNKTKHLKEELKLFGAYL